MIPGNSRPAVAEIAFAHAQLRDDVLVFLGQARERGWLG
jgi:hypothetical protein